MNIQSKKQQTLLFFLFSILFSISSFGQEETKSKKDIYLISQSYGDSIKLRWAPTTYDLWLLGNEYGYKVTRTRISKNGKPVTSEEAKEIKLIAESLKPLPAESWRPMVENDDMAFLAAGILYGEGFEYKPEIKSHLDFKAIYETSLSNDYRFGYCLYAADNSFEVAKALGVGIVDTDVNPKDGYIYEVSFMKMPEGKVVESSRSMIISNEKMSLPPPQYFGLVFDDLKVQLHWNAALQQKIYTSFQVERSTDKGQTFQKVNTSPVVHLQTSEENEFVFYPDSLENNETEYTYRVIGKTPFGDFGPPSEELTGKGIPTPLPLSAQITGVTEFPKGMIQLRWQFDTTYINEVKGFDIYRAASSKSEYVKVNETILTGTEFVYTDQEPLNTAYYKIVVIDVNDNQKGSFPVLAQLEDLEAPLPPIGVEGELDPETGIVTLNWTPNEEEDLKGYRVFRSNQLDGHYFQITKTPTLEASFIDTVTMNTIAEKVYYKIAATDFRDNYSFHSEACIVERPDKHGPTPPVLSVVKADTKGVHLNWASSSSKDVIGHELHRKVLDSPDWEVLYLYQEKRKTVSFLDTTASKRLDYEYRVVATDDADLQSFSKTLQSKPIDNHLREGIQNLSAAPNRQYRIVQLSWDYDALDRVLEFVIYRAKKNQSISTYKVVNPIELKVAGKEEGELNGKIFFEDHNVERGEVYTYQILAKHKDGGFTPLTEPISSRF